MKLHNQREEKLLRILRGQCEMAVKRYEKDGTIYNWEIHEFNGITSSMYFLGIIERPYSVVSIKDVYNILEGGLYK